MSMPQKLYGWIGVDLDGTLAEYNGWLGIEHIGVPISAMVKRVKEWLEAGTDVRIFTARAMDPDPAAVRFVEQWCVKHLGRKLKVTACKDYLCFEIWDDRAFRVEFNTGKLLSL